MNDRDIRLKDLHARAVRASVTAVSSVRPDDLARPTPCTAWTLADLIDHMVAEHRSFAAAARGAEPPGGAEPPVRGESSLAGYEEAAEDVIAAFGEPGVLDREVSLPQLSPDRAIPARSALRAHLIDYVVHSWDVARSLGADADIDDDVLDEALTIAQRIPDGPFREGPRAVFGPAVPAGPAAGPLDRIVAMLGRRPEWPS